MDRRQFLLGALAVVVGGPQMADPTVSPSLARMLAEYERRIRTLETAAQLGNSSITGGRLRVLTAAGAPVAAFGADATDPDAVGSLLYASDGSVLAAFGQVPALSGGEGVQLGSTANPTFLWNQTDGQLRPHQISVFAPSQGAQIITSGSYVLAHDCWFEKPQTKYLHVRFAVGIDAGVTGEFRMVHVGGSTTNTLSLSSVPGAVFTVELAWAPASLTINTAAKFRLEARRTAGAANVNVYNPYGAELGDFRSTATSGGAWTYA
jgi:hypothetical protein